MRIAAHCLSCWWLLSLAAAPCVADTARFLQEIREIQQRYDDWSARLIVRVVDVPGATLQEIRPDDWEQPMADAFHGCRIARNGKKFRLDVESLERSIGARVERSWDGRVERYREQFLSQNGADDGTAYQLDPTPHLMILNAMEESFVQRYGRPMHLPRYRFDFSSTDFAARADIEIGHVTEEVLGSQPCWRIEFTSNHSLGKAQLWLSKQHDLLPIREEQRRYGELHQVFRAESFQSSPGPGGEQRWFPKRCVLLTQVSPGVRVRDLRWEVRSDEQDETVFSQIDLTTPSMLAGKTTKPVPPGTPALPGPPVNARNDSGALYRMAEWKLRRAVSISAVVIPILIVLWLAMRQRRLRNLAAANSWHSARNFAFVLAGLATITCIAMVSTAEMRGYGAIGLIPLIPLTWVLLRRAESTDLAPPNYRVRTVMGIVGAALTAAVFGGLCLVPSWGSHGVAAALAGVFGLLWIALMQCFIRSRRFSIISILSLATCLALIMSGYQSATREIRSRQKMMDALDVMPDAEYGFFQTRYRNSGWIRTPEGLRIPRSFARVLGRASLGRVRWIEVPSAAFTAANLSQWSLATVTNLAISDSDKDDVTPEPRVIGRDAVQAIPTSTPLDYFYSDVVLDDDAIQSLARFRELETVSLHLDSGNPSASLAEISSLKTLHLADARIDAAGTEILSNLPSLNELFLRHLRVSAGATQATRFPAAGRITLKSTQITPAIVAWLGRGGFSVIRLQQCTFANSFSDTSNPLGAHTLSVENTPMTDADLWSLFESSERLNFVQLDGTRVTPQGMDRCSNHRPRFAINLR